MRFAAGGERAGFDFEVMSDHFFPWLDEQGHSPYAWSVLGAVTQATERVGLMTYVTCPTVRYHPAVVAQKAATVQLLSGNRFTLGLGAGGEPQRARCRPGLAAGQRPASPPPRNFYAVVASQRTVRTSRGCGWVPSRSPEVLLVGARLCSAPLADAMIAVEPDAELCGMWDSLRDGDSIKIAQLPVCWDDDRRAAIRRAHEQFRWFGGGWKVNVELPSLAGFAAATQFVTEEDVAGEHSVRTRRRADRGCGQTVLGSGFHPSRRGADRRRARAPGRVPLLRQGAAAARAPRASS